jgi:DNA-directed RNA polymerase specialized sigma24 family protein
MDLQKHFPTTVATSVRGYAQELPMDQAHAISLRNISSRLNKICWKEIPDRQLVELCLKDMEDAWVEFLRRYHSLMVGVIARTLRPSIPSTSSLLMDLLQEVLAKICANACRPLRELEWRHEGSLRGLLRVVSSTVTQDYIRRCLAPGRDVRRVQPLDEHRHNRGSSGSLATVEHKILLEQLTHHLAKSIRSGSNRVQDIAMFLLYYSYGVGAAELARIYHLGIKTVENKLARLTRLACRSAQGKGLPSRRKRRENGSSPNPTPSSILQFQS